MDVELEHIARVRKQFGLTQSELADKAGVSQSLIAKIETGRTEPTYGKARRILSVLEEQRDETAETAGKIMQRDVKACGPETPVADVIDTMHEHSISQVPVVREGTVVGLITETLLLGLDIDEQTRANTVMDEAPPTVSSGTPEPMVRTLLQHVPLVVVKDTGEIAGVIAKADVLSADYS